MSPGIGSLKMREAGKNSRPLASPRSSQSQNGTLVGCADSFGWIAMHIQISIAIHLSIDNRGALVEGVSISPGDSRACARGRENSANSAASSRYLIFRDPPSSLDTPNSYQLATSIGRETDRPSIREPTGTTGAVPRGFGGRTLRQSKRAQCAVPIFRIFLGTGAIAIPRHPAPHDAWGEKYSAENAMRRPFGDHTA
jgi:hypothetical protein